jgi:hypothetical protein
MLVIGPRYQTQRWVNGSWGPMSVFSARPQSAKKCDVCVCVCVLDAFLYYNQRRQRARKPTLLLLYLKAQGVLHPHARQVALPQGTRS